MAYHVEMISKELETGVTEYVKDETIKKMSKLKKKEDFDGTTHEDVINHDFEKV